MRIRTMILLKRIGVMKKTSLLIAMVILAMVESANAQTTKPAPRPCETDARHRQFDFWVGEWRVTTQQSQFIGDNRIERVEGGCLLQENWTDRRGETGRSMNFFDAVLGKWRQVWVSPTGGALELTGEFKDDAMRFVGERHDINGKTVPTRLTFFKLGADKVRQFAEHSTDGGKTWTTSYDFLYTRKSAAK